MLRTLHLWWLRWYVKFLDDMVEEKEGLMDDHQQRLDALYARRRRIRSTLATIEDPQRMMEEALRNGGAR